MSAVSGPRLLSEQLRRDEFSAAASSTYFDHASDSPLPRRSARVIAERIALLENPRLTVEPREHYLERAKRAIGHLVGGAPEQIAFLTNASDATATLANGFNWRRGDEVVVVSGEFASFVYPWKALERLGVQVRVAPGNGIATDLDLLDAAIGERTRVVAISHVTFSGGYRYDLARIAELAHSRGALLVVDASQSLGVLPIDAARHGIDAVVSVGYKWLMSPHGISVLYVAPETTERFWPTAPGRYSVTSGWQTDDYPLDWYPDARRFQGGALNWVGVCALAESASLLSSIGLDDIGAATADVLDEVITRLANLPVEIVSDLSPEHRSTILIFTFGSMELDDAFVAHASAHDVVLGRRAHGVRIGAHLWNNTDDVDRLIAAVESFLKERGR
jgi:cysteine desulfurase/selenocysteine lyase